MQKRKDSHGRCLYLNETERGDGYYHFTYIDPNGKRRYVYAKNLKALREKEEVIKRDLLDGIDTLRTNKISVDELFVRYMKNKQKLSRSTRLNYEYLYERFVHPYMGEQKISDVKYSMVLTLFNTLLQNMSYGTIHIIYNFLKPMFDLCVSDDVLRKNPILGILRDVRNENDLKKNKRHALNLNEQFEFMRFVEKSNVYKKYYNLFIVFLGTGARAGELLGLTWDDVDFDKNVISINHNLTYLKGDNGTKQFYCGKTKTPAAMREIPLFTEVKYALLREKEAQQKRPCVAEIDGYSNFVFTNSAGKPFHPSEINRLIDNISARYNKKSEIFRIRHFSMHSLRHTFATNLCMCEDNLKVIQTIMGHSNISVTMNIYAECTENKMQNEVKKLDGKIAIGLRDI